MSGADTGAPDHKRNVNLRIAVTEQKPDMAVILDHFQQPRNYGLMEWPNVDEELSNPGCGDRVRIQAHVVDGILEDVRFVGNGCTISMASASLLTTLAKGSALKDVVRLPEEIMIEQLRMSISPRRYECALLAFRALRKGLVVNYHERRLRDEAR